MRSITSGSSITERKEAHLPAKVGTDQWVDLVPFFDQAGQGGPSGARGLGLDLLRHPFVHRGWRLRLRCRGLARTSGPVVPAVVVNPVLARVRHVL